MTMDTQWSAGARNDALRSIDEKLGELIEVMREKNTLVPLVLFVPNDIRPDQVRAIGEYISAELRRLGLMRPEADPEPEQPKEGE